MSAFLNLIRAYRESQDTAHLSWASGRMKTFTRQHRLSQPCHLVPLISQSLSLNSRASGGASHTLPLLLLLTFMLLLASVECVLIDISASGHNSLGVTVKPPRRGSGRVFLMLFLLDIHT